MLRSWRAFVTFAIRYRGRKLEEWIGVHEALRDGYTETENGLFSEFKAMKAFTMPPDVWYSQPREMRVFLTGGTAAEGALQSMEQHDRAEEAKARREAESKKSK